MVMLSKDPQDNATNTATNTTSNASANKPSKKMHFFVKVGIALSVLSVMLTGGMYGVMTAHGVTVSIEDRELSSAVRPISEQVINVEMSGPFDLVLVQNAKAGIHISAPKNVLEQIETSVEGDTLRISAKRNVAVNFGHSKIEVSLPKLSKLEIQGSGASTVNGFSGENLSLALRGSGDVGFDGKYKNILANLRGSGDMRINGGNSDDVKLELNGSGDMIVQGHSKALSTKLNGSGDLNAENLPSDSVNVELHGSGNTAVHAKQSVKVALRGSGDITIHGQPSQRDVMVKGSGDVEFE